MFKKILALVGLLASSFTINAATISSSYFSSSASIESFENIVGIVSPITSTGTSAVGVPYHFDSGITISSACQNVLQSDCLEESTWQGPTVSDFSQGFTSYGLGSRGLLSSASALSSGTGFLSRPSGAITFVFDSTANAVGAYVTAGKSSFGNGLVKLSAYQANGGLIEATSMVFQGAFDHSLDFIGLQSDTPISYIEISGDYLILDDLTFQPSVVPIPAAAWLFGSALLGLVGIGRKRKQA